MEIIISIYGIYIATTSITLSIPVRMEHVIREQSINQATYSVTINYSIYFSVRIHSLTDQIQETKVVTW